MKKNYIGNKYGKLTILSVNGNKFVCQCDCGRIKVINKYLVLNGVTSDGRPKDCGCGGIQKRIKNTTIDMVGKKFGRLTVLESAGKDNQGQILYKCKCNCGNITIKRGYKMRQGAITSCGKCRYINGIKEESIYQRFNKLKKQSAKLGIEFCKEWLDNPCEFEEWVNKTRNGRFLLLDKTAKICSPDTCYWTDSPNNATLNVIIDGEKYTLRQLSDMYNIKYVTLSRRYNRGIRDKNILIDTQKNKPVLKYDLSGNLVAEYNTVIETIVKDKITEFRLLNNLKGITKSVDGYVYKYKPVSFKEKNK